MGIMVNVSVAGSRGEAEEARARALASSQAVSDRYIREGRGTSLSNRGRQGQALSVSAGIVGTPDEVLDELRPSLEHSHFTHYVYRGSGDKSLFVKEVMPVLKKWGREAVKTL
jgi:alkanesulfonate monooxygenase SsuD/methylene tetrahydromethanopterin reductase-like flavin-dependent oxidoreductase (luciferase family)